MKAGSRIFIKDFHKKNKIKLVCRPFQSGATLATCGEREYLGCNVRCQAGWQRGLGLSLIHISALMF